MLFLLPFLLFASSATAADSESACMKQFNVTACHQMRVVLDCKCGDGDGIGSSTFSFTTYVPDNSEASKMWFWQRSSIKSALKQEMKLKGKQEMEETCRGRKGAISCDFP